MSWKLSPDKLATRDEVEKLLARIRKVPFDYSFYGTLANTGLRISEGLHLRVEHVTKNGLSVIRRKRRGLDSEVLPVSDMLMELLRARAKAVSKGWLWPGEASGCVRVLHFRKRKRSVINGIEQWRVIREWAERQELCKGGHIHKREMQRRWRLYVEELKIYRPGFGPHSLRHYAGTEFYRATKDLRATQEALGHSSPMVTTVYTHVVDMQDQVKKVRPVT